MKIPATIALALALAIPAPASALTFQVVQSGHLSARHLQEAETAVAKQVNSSVSKHWRGASAHFGTSGVPIRFVTNIATVCEVQDATGCHAFDPAAIYIAQGTFFSETFALSHEVIETIVDPNATTYLGGQLAEVCDPVNSNTYSEIISPTVGVSVSDYVFPRWYNAKATGWMDEMHTVTEPFHISSL